jgi:undecaprenyl-diphosphatase
MTEPQTPQEERAERRMLPLKGVVLFVVASIATVAFIAVALRVVEGHADSFDRSTSLALYELHSDVLFWVMYGFTTIGSGPCLWASVILVSLLAVRRGYWQMAIVLAGNGLLVHLVNVGLKQWFVRARPTLFDVITRPVTWSFPSGHAMSAVQVWGAIAAVLIALYPRRRVVCVACAVSLIAGIGLSRVYLGVHWPTDVLAGVLAGIPFLAVTVHLIHRILRITHPG